MSLVTICGLLDTAAAQTVVFDVLDDGSTYGDLVAGDEIIQFDITNLAPGVIITGIVNYGTGAAPGSPASSVFYHIQTTSMTVINDSEAQIFYRVRFTGPDIGITEGDSTFIEIDGTYDDAADPDVVVNFVDLIPRASIGFGAAQTVLDMPDAIGVPDGTPFMSSLASSIGSSFSGTGKLVSEFDFKVDPGSGFTLPSSLDVMGRAAEFVFEDGFEQ